MAWRPEEQKRLTVTAEASTGTPARRLAMRATLRPCSPSGMAQPITTSSMSAGTTPGARRSASAMTAAASSSGRTTLSVPFGALPTAVRVAETITASCMSGLPVLEQVDDGITHERGLAVEQVRGVLEHAQLARLGELAVEA